LEKLKAKSAGSRQTLLEHTNDVVTAVQRLRSFWPHLPVEIETAALFHDMGKAARGFQKMLADGTPWKFRHEVLSAAIFSSCHDITTPFGRCAYLALLSHHKNLGGRKISAAFQQSTSRTKFSRWFEKWGELDWKQLKEEFRPLLDNWQFDSKIDSPANEVSELMETIQPVFADLTMTFARGALVAADHLASAEIGKVLDGSNITRTSLEYNVVEQLQSRKASFGKWQPMQIKCATTVGNALLVAPTGAGKTEASLLWALNNRKGSERVFYVLPYQVSINAMAKRLCELFPDDSGSAIVGENSNVAVVHSNADLAYLQEALKDEISPEEAEKTAKANKDAAHHLYAPLKVTTVYQLLNLFFGRKFFEVGLLELSDSIVIFDEIHAYDGHTLGLIFVLLDSLSKLGVRILIMTATLPTNLKNKLKFYGHISDQQEIALPSEDPLLSEARRELVLCDEVIEDPIVLEVIKDKLQKGLSVAVVCNSVSKAILMSHLLEDYNPYLVHSRFTLGDRARREQKTIIASKKLVIATQILEVSLDVSFETMFTELAPADSLLQRFGRVNRHGNSIETKKVWVCCGEDRASRRVYDVELLARTESWGRSHVTSGSKLTFNKSLEWIETVYPKGLSEKELEAMEYSRSVFQEIVNVLKPMMDPVIDSNIEITLFESITVVPSKFERQWREAITNKQYLKAKELTVNVNFKSWSGAIANAKQAGFIPYRKVVGMGNKHEILLACFHYSNDDVADGFCIGLDLLNPEDESDYHFLD
jgi:CRISPR-associated endonuclease/helicase Cas3